MHCSARRKREEDGPPWGGGQGGPGHGKSHSPGLGLLNEVLGPGETLGSRRLKSLLPRNGWDPALIGEDKIHHGLCSAALG